MWRVAVSVAGLAAVGFGPSPAPAMAPLLPTCDAGSMGAAERAEFGFVPPPGWAGFPVDRPAEGWVYYRTYERPVRGADGEFDRDWQRLVLENCESRERMVAWVGTAGLDAGAYSVRYEALAFGIFNRATDAEARRYTLAQLAGWVRAQGDRAQVDRAGYLSCACAAAARLDTEGR